VNGSVGGRPADGLVGDSAFGAYYYANCCGRPYGRTDDWLAAFGRIADAVVRDIAPGRVLDAGCAVGLLVETLRDRGVEAWGVDVSSHAIANLHEKVRPYCRHGSIADEFDDTYDLIVCVEVVEHMTPTAAEAAIANVCRHADDVLFSSSPHDYREPTHVNVQPPEHWAELFARHGFFRDVDFDASFVTPWAARYRHRNEPVHKLVRAYERRYWHLLAAAQDARAYSIEQQAQIEGLQGQLAELRRSLDEQHGAVSALQEALAQSRDRVYHMERSLFWKARGLWTRMAALTGRRS